MPFICSESYRLWKTHISLSERFNFISGNSSDLFWRPQLSQNYFLLRMEGDSILLCTPYKVTLSKNSFISFRNIDRFCLVNVIQSVILQRISFIQHHLIYLMNSTNFAYIVYFKWILWYVWKTYSLILHVSS